MPRRRLLRLPVSPFGGLFPMLVAAVLAPVPPRSEASPPTTQSVAPATQPAAASAEDPAAWALRLPRLWPGGTYRFTGRGGVHGRIVQRNEVVRRDGRDGRDELKLTDVLDMEGGGRKATTTYTTWCRPDAYLTPTRVEGEEPGPVGPSRVLDLRLDEGTIQGTRRGQPVVAVAATPLVTELALFRVVTLMPLREGAELRFHGLQSTEARVLGEQLLRCAGRERIKIGDREYDAWRFDHTGIGIRPSTYWVNADRFFLRALLAGADEWVFEPIKRKE